MRFPKLVLVCPLLIAVLAQGCATVEPEGYGAEDQSWALYGQVDAVRQLPRYVRGDPSGGAVGGAIIGGLLGTMLGGRGLGTVAGAAGGAAIGANSSQGGYVGSDFEVDVQFDDGNRRAFRYRDRPPPLGPGDYVVWTPQGLARR